MFSGAMQPLHLVLILIVVLIIFGPGKLPDAGKALGKTIREFRKATNSIEDEIVNSVQSQTAHESTSQQIQSGQAPVNSK